MRPPTILAALLAGVALIVTTTAKAEFVDGDRIRTLDGDTVALPCAVIFRGCAEKVRLTSIDTPESFRPRCENELVLGLAAKQRLVELLRGHQVEVVRSGKLDRYRRTLGDLHVDGTDVGAVLLREGYAPPYRPGRAAKEERLRVWCPEFTEEVQP